ncbi:unnamed protein product [Orchesella dallaii]|uniref:CCHC-type domain-containing protein n=1 Tax=Orchesella dallaii TaxID=48710 RepID=A0ABP1QWS8_9HEXA
MRANSRRRPISTSPQVVVHSHRTRSNRSASVDSPLLSLPPPTRRRRVVKSKVMAGQANNANVPVGPQVVLDANLAQGLNADQQSAINAFLAQQVVLASCNVRVSGMHAKLPIPEYDPNSMTSTSYFTQCENFFQAQGIQAAQYHIMIGTTLKPDKKTWYDNVAPTLNTWEDFKLAFASRFDSLQTQERRKKLLWSRQQTLTESVEQFLNEMVNLAKQIDPTEAEHISVLRAKNSLVPDLRLHIQIGDPGQLTINSLLEKAADAIDALVAKDSLTGRHTALPPLYGFKQTVHETKPKPNSPNFRGRGRSSFTYGRGSYRGRGSHNNHTSNFQSNGNSSTTQSNPNSQQHSNGNANQFRSRINSAPTERGNFVRTTEPQRVKCYNCEEIGHYARDCDKQVRNANGSAMLMQAQNANNNPSGNGSSNQPPQSNSSQFSQEREPQRNNSLNFRGNRHRNRR